MRNTMRIALASAAVVAVALLGINFLRAPNVGGPGLGDPTPTAAPTLSPRPLTAGRMEPGTYVAGDPFSLRVTFTVPAGWRGNIGGPYYVHLERVDQPGGIDFSIFDEVSADPCHPELGFLDPPPGPTVEDLATALANVPGLEVTDISDVTVDGYRGTQLVMVAPDNFAGCTLDSDGYVIWQLPLGHTHFMVPSERDRVWILDAEGLRLVILAPEAPGFTDGQRAEVDLIFDSLDIEPAS